MKNELNPITVLDAIGGLEISKMNGSAEFRGNGNRGSVQALIAGCEHIPQPEARAAKSSANLLCHARAVSVTARWAAMRSSTARRR
jgi:hypothetical protein